MRKYSPQKINSSKQEALRKKRVSATIADGIAIQDRFKAEPLLKVTGRGSYRSDLVAELAAAKKRNSIRT